MSWLQAGRLFSKAGALGKKGLGFTGDVAKTAGGKLKSTTTADVKNRAVDAAKLSGNLGADVLMMGAGLDRSMFGQGWKSPKGLGLIGASAGVFGGGFALGIKNDIDEAQEAEQHSRQLMREEAVALQRTRTQTLLDMAEEERTRQSMMASVARLAQADPHLYREVMAGRRLPKGSTVIGGRPRVDLMDQLAYSMASGQYVKPTGQDQLAALAQSYGVM